jgi:hypothetical protein
MSDLPLSDQIDAERVGRNRIHAEINLNDAALTSGDIIRTGAAEAAAIRRLTSASDRIKNRHNRSASSPRRQRAPGSRHPEHPTELTSYGSVQMLLDKGPPLLLRFPSFADYG